MTPWILKKRRGDDHLGVLSNSLFWGELNKQKQGKYNKLVVEPTPSWKLCASQIGFIFPKDPGSKIKKNETTAYFFFGIEQTEKTCKLRHRNGHETVFVGIFESASGSKRQRIYSFTSFLVHLTTSVSFEDEKSFKQWHIDCMMGCFFPCHFYKTASARLLLI